METVIKQHQVDIDSEPPYRPCPYRCGRHRFATAKSTIFSITRFMVTLGVHPRRIHDLDPLPAVESAELIDRSASRRARRADKSRAHRRRNDPSIEVETQPIDAALSRPVKSIRHPHSGVTEDTIVVHIITSVIMPTELGNSLARQRSLRRRRRSVAQLPGAEILGGGLGYNHEHYYTTKCADARRWLPGQSAQGTPNADLHVRRPSHICEFPGGNGR